MSKKGNHPKNKPKSKESLEKSEILVTGTQALESKSDILARLLKEFSPKSSDVNKVVTNDHATRSLLSQFQSEIGPLDEIEEGN